MRAVKTEVSLNSDIHSFDFDMTPQQRQVWSECTSPSSRFNAAFRVEISGKIDASLLRSTVVHLLNRFEALRANCDQVAGVPVIVVNDPVSPAFVTGCPDVFLESDLSAYGDAERHLKIEQISTTEARHVFDLHTPPLFRFHHVKQSDNLSLLTMTFHQILIDGWSVELIIEDMVAIYAALAAGRAIDLPPPPLQLTDYAAWLNDHLSAPSVHAQATDFLRELVDYQRIDIKREINLLPPDTTDNIVAFELSSQSAETLATMSKSSGRTAFVIGASACLAAVNRLTGREDVAIGSPMSGRNLPDLDGVVGTTVDAMLIRVHIEPQTKLDDIQTRVATITANALDRNGLPLAFMCELASASAHKIPDPLFTIAFICQQAFGGRLNKVLEFAGCKLRTLPSISPGALHDLFFFMVQRETGWRVALEYNPAKISQPDAEIYLESFRRMLQTTLNAPATRVADVALTLPENWIAQDLTRYSPDTGDIETDIAQDNVAPDKTRDFTALSVPASVAQERYYYLTKLFPESPAFNLPACRHIAGPLNLGSLNSAIAQLVERHEGLRTSFRECDGALMQVVEPAGTLEVDYRDLTGATREAIGRILVEEGRRAFELSGRPPTRLQVFTTGHDRHTLLLTAHHIVADGHSMGLLDRELWKAYEAIEQGQSATATPLEIQYLDYSTAQNDWLATDAAEHQRTFWMRTLAGPLPVADIPVDREPVTAQSTDTAVLSIAISQQLSQELHAYCAAHALTPYQLTAAAFASLIAEVSGTSDVLFGSPIANRSDETQDVVGPFAGVLPIRVDLSDCRTIEEAKKRAVTTIVESFDNCQYPLDLLLNELDAPTRGGRTPIFQLFFLYQAAYLQEIQSGDLTITPGLPIEIDAPYELKFALIQRTHTLDLDVEYKTSLFDASTVTKLIAQYVHILTELLHGEGARPLRLVPRRSHSPETPQSAPLVSTEAPKTDTERFLASEFEAILRRQNVSRASSFFDLGGQSIAAVRLFRAINTRFGLDIPISKLLRFPTPADLGAHIETLLNPGNHTDPSQAYRFLVPIGSGTSSSAPTLFVCAGAGGNVLNLRDLAKSLVPDISLVGIQARGITDDEVPHTNLEDMASDYLDEVKRLQQHGPYFFGGYSAGGIIAFEMARQMTERGERVGLVILFDTILPNVRQLSVKDRIEWRIRHIGKQGLSVVSNMLAVRTQRTFERVREAFGLGPPPTIDQKMRAAMSACCRKYVVLPYDEKVLLLRPPITVNVTLTDGRTVAWDGTVVRYDNHWGEFIGNFTIRTLGGHHFNFIEGENTPEVAAAILQEIRLVLPTPIQA